MAKSKIKLRVAHLVVLFRVRRYHALGWEGFMRKTLLLVVAVAVSGCGGANMAAEIQASNEAASDLQKAIDNCNRVHATAKLAVPLVRCWNDAEMRWQIARAQSVGGQSLPFVQSIHAQMIVAAERHDMKKITPNEFMAEYERLKSQMTDRLNAESQAVHTANQQAQQAASARAIAVGASIMAGPPSTTCTTFGNTMTCR